MNKIEALKQLLDYFRPRHEGEEKIDAAEHNRILNSLVDTLVEVADKSFLGHAKLDTIPEAPQKNSYYLATQKGNYVHFGDIQINSHLAMLLWNGIDWIKEEIEVDVNLDVNIDDYIDLKDYAKLVNDNTFIGKQQVVGELEIGKTRGSLRPVARQSRKMTDKQAVVYNALLDMLETVNQVPDSKLWDTKKFDDYIDQPLRTTDDVVHKSFSTPEFIPGMSGKGARIDEYGNIQAESMEIRSYLKVMELLYNRVLAMEGDYSFTECGTITSVEVLSIDEKTYRLTMRKRHEGDFTAFRAHDVIYGIVNSLTSDGLYYWSWMRVITVNTVDNTLTVVMYPDAEVPAQKNFPPTKLMNITRRGNGEIPAEGENERSNSWTLSSNEGRITFYKDVFKPILEDNNIAAFLGKKMDISALKGLPIADNAILFYSEYVAAKRFYEVDHNGNVAPKEVARGTWSLDVANSANPYRYVQTSVELPNGQIVNTLEYHTVYHLGCKWQCTTDKTISEPKWNSVNWLMIEGNSELAIAFKATQGFQFRLNAVSGEFEARIYHGNTDITEEVINAVGFDAQWTRDSKRPADDLVWNPTTGLTKNILVLANHDMPTDFHTTRSVEFICKIYVPVRGEIKELKGSLGLKM